MNEIRCGNCNHWLGESPEPLIFVEDVTKSEKARVDPPRDLRLCKSCGRVNVFITLKELDGARDQAVA